MCLYINKLMHEKNIVRINTVYTGSAAVYHDDAPFVIKEFGVSNLFSFWVFLQDHTSLANEIIYTTEPKKRFLT